MEHEPAHSHAEHAGQQAKFDFDGVLIAGEIRSRRARERIRRWTELHRAAVQGNTMTFLPSVVRAEHRGGFQLHIVFNDGSENTIDFSEWLVGPMFEPLRAPDFFSRFFVDGGTVVWPNGADIAPETLYEVAGRRQRPARRVRPTKARRPAAEARRSRTRLRG